MPRDFVPCLYHEREMFDEMTETWHRRFEVTEGFLMADRVTQEPYVPITRDSHAYFVGRAESALERRMLVAPWRVHEYTTQHARTELFRTFYAAMAALD